MGLVLVFQRGGPDVGLVAGLAAQIEAGMARVVIDRRTGRDRRHERAAREHGMRAAQRRQAVPLPVSPRIVVTV